MPSDGAGRTSAREKGKEGRKGKGGRCGKDESSTQHDRRCGHRGKDEQGWAGARVACHRHKLQVKLEGEPERSGVTSGNTEGPLTVHPKSETATSQLLPCLSWKSTSLSLSRTATSPAALSSEPPPGLAFSSREVWDSSSATSEQDNGCFLAVPTQERRRESRPKQHSPKAR